MENWAALFSVVNSSNPNALQYDCLNSQQINDINKYQNLDKEDILAENRELVSVNAKLLDRLRIVEERAKINKVFDKVGLNINKKDEIKKFLQQTNHEIEEKTTQLQFIKISNDKLSSHIDIVSKRLLEFHPSRLQATIVQDKKQTEELKGLIDFFSSTVIYSIKEKESQVHKNKNLLEKILMLAKHLEEN